MAEIIDESKSTGTAADLPEFRIYLSKNLVKRALADVEGGFQDEIEARDAITQAAHALLTAQAAEQLKWKSWTFLDRLALLGLLEDPTMTNRQRVGLFASLHVADETARQIKEALPLLENILCVTDEDEFIALTATLVSTLPPESWNYDALGRALLKTKVVPLPLNSDTTKLVDFSNQFWEWFPVEDEDRKTLKRYKNRIGHIFKGTGRPKKRKRTTTVKDEDSDEE